jgi:hypothetical protein
MPVYDTFSKRLKREQEAGQSDVYKYDDLPANFLNQVCYIWNSAVGRYESYDVVHTPLGPKRVKNAVWLSVYNTMRREEGTFVEYSADQNPKTWCLTHLVRTDTSGALNLIEMSFRFMCRRTLTSDEAKGFGITQTLESAISELNTRFQENDLGYEFVIDEDSSDGKLIRKDSTFIHANAVLPAIALLRGAGFDGANEEFFKAYEHLMRGNNKNAIVESAKAVESAMIAICQLRAWPISSTATANELIKAVAADGRLLSADMQNTLMGLFTIRNRIGAHGQGAQPVEAADHMVLYAVHLAAADLVLLMNAHNAMPLPSPATALT